jgi:hypothetical protein
MLRKGVDTMARVEASKKETVTKLPEGTKTAKGGKETILEVLARAAEDSEFLAKLSENPEKALSEYVVLTWEERAALASGDIKKIESWVGKLDKKMATWLWCRLSQEKW